MCITSKHRVYPRCTCMSHIIHPPPPLTCFRAQPCPQTFHSTRLPSRRSPKRATTTIKNQQETHYNTQPLARTHNLQTKMSEATPRVTAPYLEQFSHQTVRILGKVRQLRGEQATIDAGGQISVFLNRVCCLFLCPLNCCFCDEDEKLKRKGSLLN